MSAVPACMSPVQRLMGSWVRLDQSEIRGLLCSFGGAFTMFAAYSLLRPIRETMGMTSGIASLPWLFWSTFALMLVVQPVYGWLMSRFRREQVLPRIYVFFALSLVAFYVWFFVQADHAWIARVYFVWVSVFSLFIVAVFWSLMADVFTREQAGRLFGPIAAGLSAGGLAGSCAAGWLAKPLGTINLLLVSALLLLAASAFMKMVSAWYSKNSDFVRGVRRADEKLEGGPWAGFALVAKSPYLIGIAIFVLMLTSSTTIIYIEQNRSVALAIESTDARTAFFGQIDFWVQAAALFCQLLLFGPLLSRLGFTAMICATPALMLAAFAVIWWCPGFDTVVAAMVMRRIGEYAFTRPSRDMLFTAVSREEKYKAKSLLDTFVYRGGDAMSASLYQGFWSSGTHAAAFAGGAGMLVSAMWLAVGVWLARKFRGMKPAH